MINYYIYYGIDYITVESIKIKIKFKKLLEEHDFCYLFIKFLIIINKQIKKIDISSIKLIIHWIQSFKIQTNT